MLVPLLRTFKASSLPNSVLQIRIRVPPADAVAKIFPLLERLRQTMSCSWHFKVFYVFLVELIILTWPFLLESRIAITHDSVIDETAAAPLGFATVLWTSGSFKSLKLKIKTYELKTTINFSCVRNVFKTI